MLYPIGIQNFEKIIKGSFAYVDKTDWAQYPILHINSSGRSYLSAQDLYLALDFHLTQWEVTYNVAQYGKDPSSSLSI